MKTSLFFAIVALFVLPAADAQFSGGSPFLPGGPRSLSGGPAPTNYWKGGTDNTWSGTNWTSDAAGTAPTTPPDSSTDVFFSATGATNQGNTTLDTDFTIYSLNFIDSNNVVINGPGTLTIAGFPGITVNSGAGLVTIGADVVLSGSNLITVNNTAGLIINGALGGTIGFDKEGTGMLVLTNPANNYSGTTTVGAGTLQAGAANVIPSASPVVVNSSGTFDLHSFNQSVGSIAGAGIVSLGSAVFTVGNDGTSTTFSGVIQDGLASGGTGGSLVKVGTGTLILSGINAYTGATTVNSGILEVNGSIANSATTVTSLGTLQGIGGVGRLTNNGTVSPGSTAGGPGTLAVNGNYTQGSGGSLQIGLASISTFGRVAVNGTASLNGSLIATSLGSFSPQVGNNFPILNASSGVAGTFSTVVDHTLTNGTLVKLQVTYNPTGVTLQFVQGAIPLPPASGGTTTTTGGTTSSSSNPVTTNGITGLTSSGLAVAREINSALNDPRLAPVLKFLDRLPLGSLSAALDRIAPEELSALTSASSSLSNVQIQNIQTRLDALISGVSGFTAQGMHLAGNGPNYAGSFMGSGFEGPNGADGKESKEAAPYNPRLGTFITGAGEWVSVGNTDNARGYDLATGGFTLGVDYKLTDHLAIGLDAGYAHTGIDLENGGHSAIDAGNVGLYGTYFTGGFYADGAVTGTYSGYDNRRAALQGDARGQTHSGAIDALFATGYNWHAGGLTLGPTGSFHYNYTQIRDYSEHGSLAPMSFPTQGVDSIRSAFGAKATYDWHAGGVLIRPEVSLAWQHEYGRTNPGVVTQFANGAGNQFTVFGPDTGRDSLLLGAGFAVIWSERISSFAYYDGEFARTNYNMSSVTGGFRLTF